MSTWVEEFFVEHSNLYMRQLEAQWDRGIEEAELIDSAIKELGLKVRKVLDVPCGIGRISMPLAKMGYDVVGVDISPEFTEYARRKATEAGLADRARFYVGDMREVDEVLDERGFDLVLTVFSSIGYYGEDGDARFFQASRRVTGKGGVLGIVRIMNKESLLTSFCPRIFDDSRGLIVLQANRFDHLASTLHSRWRYLVRRGEAYTMEADLELSMRIYGISELSKLLESTGWRVTAYSNSLRNLKSYDPKQPGLNIFAQAV